MKENIIFAISMVVVLYAIILTLFVFIFCIPVIDDYRTQLEILKNRGCVVSEEEWRCRNE